MVRERANYGGTTQITGGAVRATVDLEVLRRLPNSYVMRWLWSPVTLEDTPQDHLLHPFGGPALPNSGWFRPSEIDPAADSVIVE